MPRRRPRRLAAIPFRDRSIYMSTRNRQDSISWPMGKAAEHPIMVMITSDDTTPATALTVMGSEQDCCWLYVWTLLVGNACVAIEGFVFLIVQNLITCDGAVRTRVLDSSTHESFLEAPLLHQKSLYYNGLIP